MNDHTQWHVVVCGVKDNKNVSVLFSVDATGYINSKQIEAFDGLEITAGVYSKEKVIIQVGSKLLMYKVEPQGTFTKLDESVDLKQDSKLIGHSDGVMSISVGKSTIETFDLKNRFNKKED